MSRNLSGYSRSEATRSRSADQVDATIDFLGTDGLLVMRTPGTAANEEFHELQAKKLTNSRIFFYEVDNAVISKNLETATENLAADLLAILPSKPSSILDAPWEHEDINRYKGIWWDWDGTCNPITVVDSHLPNLLSTIDYMLLSRVPRIALSLTMSLRAGRRGGSRSDMEDAVDAIEHAIGGFDEWCTSAVEYYHSGSHRFGQNQVRHTPMVTLDFYFREDRCLRPL